MASRSLTNQDARARRYEISQSSRRCLKIRICGREFVQRHRLPIGARVVLFCLRWLRSPRIRLVRTWARHRERTRLAATQSRNGSRVTSRGCSRRHQPHVKCGDRTRRPPFSSQPPRRADPQTRPLHFFPGPCAFPTVPFDVSKMAQLQLETNRVNFLYTVICNF